MQGPGGIIIRELVDPAPSSVRTVKLDGLSDLSILQVTEKVTEVARKLMGR
jgi:hypothetical protein